MRIAARRVWNKAWAVCFLLLALIGFAWLMTGCAAKGPLVVGPVIVTSGGMPPGWLTKSGTQ